MTVFFFQAEDGIRDHCVTGVQTCALPISLGKWDASIKIMPKISIEPNWTKLTWDFLKKQVQAVAEDICEELGITLSAGEIFEIALTFGFLAIIVVEFVSVGMEIADSLEITNGVPRVRKARQDVIDGFIEGVLDS